MPRIMLAEDDYTMVTLLKTLLGMEGYQVIALTVDDDVFESVRNDRPDVLLLDLFIAPPDSENLRSLGIVWVRQPIVHRALGLLPPTLQISLV